MRTYKKVIEKPLLEITNDEFAESPRENCDNIGHFIICSRKYQSPDNYPELEKWIENASHNVSNIEEHIKTIKEFFSDDEVLFIYPVCTYEHGNRSFSLGVKHGFDYSNNGYYIVTKTKASLTLNEFNEDNIKEIINQELEEYRKYVNGELYHMALYDEEGKVVESIGSFSELEDIKEYLPEDWADEDLEQYIIN